MPDHLLVNVGNTTLRVGTSAAESWLAGTGDLLAGKLGSERFRQCPGTWVVASVVPAARQRLHEIGKACGATIHWVDAAMIPHVNCFGVDMATVGADRIANIAAAVRLLALPAIVVDCGTAITTEIVTAGPRFLGGVILPGRQMARRALHHFTGKLPEAPMASDDSPGAVGLNTLSAIRSGVDLGLLGAVRQIVETTIRECGFARCTVVATGGDAPFFTRNLECLAPAPDNFTFEGIAELGARLAEE